MKFGFFLTTLRWIFALALYGGFVCSAQAAYFEERPDILDVKPSAANAGIPGWDLTKHGQFIFLAQMLSFFPDREYFFLARDAEYLFDMAKVLAKGHPDLLSRLHLIPISRDALDNNFEEVMLKYLRQQKMSAEGLQGRTVLFVDSCCEGSVPTRLSNMLSQIGIRSQSFMLESTLYPKSRTATVLGSAGKDVEDLPHYSGSATDLVLSAQSNYKMSVRSIGRGTQAAALRVMAQLRYEFDREVTRLDFFEIVGLMRKIIDQFESNPIAVSEVKKALALLAKKHGVPAAAVLEDIQDFAENDYGKKNFATDVSWFIQEQEKFLRTLDLEAVSHYLKFPDLFGKLAVSLDHGYAFDSHTMLPTILKKFSELSIDEKNLPLAQYRELAAKWFAFMHLELGEDITFVSRVFDSFLKIREKAQIKSLLLPEFLTAFENYDLNSWETGAIRKLILKALAQTGLSSSSGSELYWLMTQKNIVHQRPGLLRFVVDEVKARGTPEERRQFAILLVENSSEYILEVDAHRGRSAQILDIVRDFIESTPGLSFKDLKRAYEKANLDFYAQDFSSIPLFRDWLQKRSRDSLIAPLTPAQTSRALFCRGIFAR